MVENGLPHVIADSYWYLAAQLQHEPNPVELLLEKSRQGIIALPKSIGIIADGNGRWATNHDKTIPEGHRAGAKQIIELLRGCRQLPIETVVVWAMSPDNFHKRDAVEVAGLMNLVMELLPNLINELQSHNSRFIHLGRKKGLPSPVASVLACAEEATKNNTGQKVALAFNFDGQTEALDAMAKAAADFKEGKITCLDDTTLAPYLDPYNIGQLDMLIRTAGDQRPSGIGRIANMAEWFFPNKLMPDYCVPDLAQDLLEYSFREKKFGGRPKIK